MAWHPALALGIAVPGTIFGGIAVNLLAGVRTDMYDVLPPPEALNVSEVSILCTLASLSSGITATQPVMLPSNVKTTTTELAISFTSEYPTCSHFSDNPVLTTSSTEEPPTRVTVGISPEPSKFKRHADGEPLSVWRDFPLLAFVVYMLSLTGILTIPGPLFRFIVSLMINAARFGGDDAVIAILIGRLTPHTQRFVREAAEFDRWNGRHDKGGRNDNPDAQNETSRTMDEDAATQTDNLPSNSSGCNEACRVRHDHLWTEATQWVSEQAAKNTVVNLENSKLKTAALNYEMNLGNLNKEYDELDEARTRWFEAEKEERAEKVAFKLQLKEARKALKETEARNRAYVKQHQTLKDFNKELKEKLNEEIHVREELLRTIELQHESLAKYDKILRDEGSTAHTTEEFLNSSA